MNDTTNVYDAIVAEEGKLMEAYNQGDMADLAALFTEDAQVLPANSDIVTGRPAIQSLYQAIWDKGIKLAQLDTLEVDNFGETAYEVGIYTLKEAEGQVLDNGKYLVICKLVEGQWKFHRTIWNSSVAEPE